MAKKRRKSDIKSNAPVEKDDGTRWVVERDGLPVYTTQDGILKREATRLAEGLLRPAAIRQIN